jgi:hypothetical protein
MPVYIARSECQVDIYKVLGKSAKKMFEDERCHIYTKSIDDCVWKFETKMTINELIEFIRPLRDCHILRQSVQLEKDFNGERIWERG